MRAARLHDTTPTQALPLAALLFTDIVDSTARASALGEDVWRELIGQHNERAQAVVDRFGGRVVEFVGDGMLARFDGAERAARAALTLRPWINELDLRLRQGIHSGEIELRGDMVRGLAVHVAARIMDLAAGDEILVSGTVRELLDGADLQFEDRGRHRLKGVNGERQVYALVG